MIDPAENVSPAKEDSPPEAPIASAIIPARRLDHRGRRCVSELLRLSPAVEVVFVSDRAEPDLDPRVALVVSGPAPVGRKRQQALEVSKGEYIALIDDDAYPGAGWMSSAIAALTTDSAVAAVCGPTLTPEDDGELEQLSGRVFASPLVSGPHRWRYKQVAPRDVDDAPSVNLIIRREDALAVGFETDYYPGDDTVICDRLVRRGRRIRFVPEAVVYHSRRPLWREHLTQVWRFARHRGAFARSHAGNSRRLSYFLPSFLLLFALAGPTLRGSSSGAWRFAMVIYLASCVIAAADRKPATWARLAVAIPATHGTYGLGFLVGIAGVPLRDADSRSRRSDSK